MRACGPSFINKQYYSLFSVVVTSFTTFCTQCFLFEQLYYNTSFIALNTYVATINSLWCQMENWTSSDLKWNYILWGVSRGKWKAGSQTHRTYILTAHSDGMYWVRKLITSYFESFCTLDWWNNWSTAKLIHDEKSCLLLQPLQTVWLKSTMCISWLSDAPALAQ